MCGLVNCQIIFIKRPFCAHPKGFSAMDSYPGEWEQPSVGVGAA